MYRSPSALRRSLPEGVLRKRMRKHRFLGLPPKVWEVLRDYFDDTSLHGLKYVSSVDVRYIERYIFLVMFFLNLLLAAVLIQSQWVKWRERPFHVTYDSSLTNIWEVPFPSVTVCSLYSVKRSFLDLTTTNNQTLLFYASKVCPVGEQLAQRVKEIDYVGHDFYDFIKNAAPSCSQTFTSCSFGGREVDCCLIFEPVVTEYGLCFTFNHLPLERVLRNTTYVPFPSKNYNSSTIFWNPQDGFAKTGSGLETYPLRQYISQEIYGLVLKLHENASEWQETCTGKHSGFKVTIPKL